MSEIITEPEVKEEKVIWKSILSFDVDETGQSRVQVQTSNEAHLALALRRMGQVVDLYLADQEAKRIKDASRIVQATVSANVLDKLRG